MQPQEPNRHVFRDLIEEHRDLYTVSYQPADARSSIAVISLFFPESPGDRSIVMSAMEKELQTWLERFPVPAKVSAYNAKKRLIRVSSTTSECHLMGYVRLVDDAIIRRWRIMDDGEIPADAQEPEHLETAYKSIPFRLREQVREMMRLDLRTKAKAAFLTLSLIVLFPVFLQAVIHWGKDLVLPLSVASIVVGLYKATGLIGWRKPSPFERRKTERILKREHYFFHCEKNPASFARLEKENFRREVSRENKEAKRLLQSVEIRPRRSLSSWLALPALFRPKSWFRPVEKAS